MSIFGKSDDVQYAKCLGCKKQIIKTASQLCVNCFGQSQPISDEDRADSIYAGSSYIKRGAR